MRFVFCLFALSVFCDIGWGSDLAEESQWGEMRAAFKSHCYDCHGEADPEGGFNFQSLSTDVSDVAVRAKWIRVFDRINLGEMPPAEASALQMAEKQRVLEPLKGALVSSHAAEKGTTLRRLNRREYENNVERFVWD